MLSVSRTRQLVLTMFLSTLILVIHGSWAGFVFAGPIAIQTPTGLQGGDTFRIIFVTPDTTNATSSDISTYDAFVNTEAAGATYNGQVIHWSAVGSTDSIGASAHIGVTGAGVYMADGTRVVATDDRSGLWAGNPLLAQPTENLSGHAYTSGNVWTGTSGIGTEYNTNVQGGGNISWGLGTNAVYSDNTGNYNNTIEIGVLHSNIGALDPNSPTAQVYDWISYGFGPGLQLNTNEYQVYGISDVLTVVPEPSTFLISGLGIVVVGLVQSFRKRKGHSLIEA